MYTLFATDRGRTGKRQRTSEAVSHNLAIEIIGITARVTSLLTSCLDKCFMKVPVFVSRPTPHLKAQQEFIDLFTHELETRGFSPLTLGPGSSYDYEAPLVGIRRMLRHCCGLVSIAFRRTHAIAATKYLGADVLDQSEQKLDDVWLTSPYCQIEPAMAFQLGLPILILREEGVLAEGVLEKGVTGLYLPEFKLATASSYVASQECRHLLEQWGGYVRAVYRKRGDPPKLFE